MPRPRLSRERPRPALPWLRSGSPRAALAPCRGGMRAGKALPECSQRPPGSRAASNCGGQPEPRRAATGMPGALPRSFVPSAENVSSFREGRRLRGTAEPRPPGALPLRRPARPAARGHVPERGERRCRRPAGRDTPRTTTDEPTARSAPPAPLTCARCPGTRGSGPCGGSASASAPTARGSPRRAASEHVRAPGMRAAGRCSALTCTGPAAPPRPRLAPRAGPRWLCCRRQQHPAEQLVQRAAAVASKGRRTCRLQTDKINVER